MRELTEAVACIGALHTRVARLLILLAQCEQWTKSDKREASYFPMIGRELLASLGIEWRPSSAPRPAPYEARATVALCELHERTSRILIDCARHPLDQALNDNVRILEIHMWALEVVSALEVDPA
jgi:hypothetical protein